MKLLKLAARAKINLTLDVLYRRADGYHEVATVMQQIDLADHLHFELAGEGGILLSCSDPEVPTGPENLVFKAAEVICPAGEAPGVKIHISKKIPVGAGLAGGSADAAAALIALNFLWKRGFSCEELKRFGAGLGADIPFCLVGGTALARGRGEQLQILPPLPLFWVVLAKVPGLSLSAGSVYRLLKIGSITRRPPTEKVVRAIQQRDRQGIREGMVNVLEEAVMPHYPQVARLKEHFQQQGLEAVMSGSGPVVFALSESKPAALEAASFLKRRGYETWLCRTCNVNPRLREEEEGNEG